MKTTDRRAEFSKDRAEKSALEGTMNQHLIQNAVDSVNALARGETDRRTAMLTAAVNLLYKYGDHIVNGPRTELPGSLGVRCDVIGMLRDEIEGLVK